MNDPIAWTNGHSRSIPIVVPRALFVRVERIAARAGMEPTELIELALSDLFNDSDLAAATLAELIRRLAGEP